MEFRLYIWTNSMISPQVIYDSFQSNILVRELTLLHFASFCVLTFIKYNKYKYKWVYFSQSIYNKVIHKQAFRLGCKKTFIYKQY